MQTVIGLARRQVLRVELQEFRGALIGGSEMDDGTQNLACSSNADAPESHPRLSSRHKSPQAFELALQRLGAAGSTTQVTALFDGHATWHQVRDWRRGRARVPQWAWDYLDLLLENRTAEINTTLAQLAIAPVAPGRQDNISAWNARKAALKAAKEKPAV